MQICSYEYSIIDACFIQYIGPVKNLNYSLNKHKFIKFICIEYYTI